MRTVFSVSFHSWKYSCLRPVCLTDNNCMPACVEHARGPWGCVCSPMHAMQQGQMTWMAKWWSSILHALRMSSSALCRTQRDAVTDVKMCVKSITQLLAWNNDQSSSSSPTPPTSPSKPLLHLLISSPQSSARGPFVYSSFQWSTPVIPVTGTRTLWQAPNLFIPSVIAKTDTNWG